MPSTALFWVVALVVLAATVAALIWPLVRAPASRGVGSADANVHVYRDQKRQLDAELAVGAITLAERTAGVDELARRLGVEVTPEEPPTGVPPRSTTAAALIVAAALPVAAMALYAAFGDPQSLRQSSTSIAETPAKPQDQLLAAIDKLASRLRQDPADANGWRLLARSYTAIGRYPEAVAAYGEASTQSPQQDASLLADWADALAMVNKSLAGEPSTLIDRALALDPQHRKALSLAASAAFERRDFDTAIAQWRKLDVQLARDSAEARDVAAMIAEATAAKLGASAALTASSPARTGTGSIAAAASTSIASAPIAGAADASAISGKVTIDPSLRAQLAPTATLFIFARAVSGPRMPLAVIRGTGSELPREFTLDDSMAMMPEARLSGADSVVVEARVSQSGSATAVTGDLQGRSNPVKPGTRDVLIVINDIAR
jgi:cytochrome c-type biogenesis protein CcmH